MLENILIFKCLVLFVDTFYYRTGAVFASVLFANSTITWTIKTKVPK
jgi:hypothetical protein